MWRSPLVTLLIAVALAPVASPQALSRQNIANILGFENSTPDTFPAGWGTNAPDHIRADGAVAHSGRMSARIERTASSQPDFSTISAVIPADFTAQTIELRAWLKLEDVRDFVALWLRLDGPCGSLAFATLQGLQVRGTADWRQYSVRIAVPDGGRQVVFGFFLSGPGKAWVDSMELVADGKPVADATGRTPTVLDTDTEFANGSGISLTSLSPLQIANLSTLGKVWGFVKYHHPAVTSGKRQWDFDLFRILPDVLSAGSAAQANDAIVRWIDSLGDIPDCSNCATLSQQDLRLAPDLAWIDDTGVLGTPLSTLLRAIHRKRSAGPQFFVEKFPGVGNPNFVRELSCPAPPQLPDSGYRLLALFRFWNMMQYFNPNRDIMGEPGQDASSYWHVVLYESIEPFATARTALAYQQELLRFIARINDTHSNLWTGLGARPPTGICSLPVDVRFVEGKPIVIRNTARAAAQAGPLKLGDILLAIDGKPVSQLLDEWRPYYAASNEPTRLRDIAGNMTRGACGPVSLTIDRDGAEQAVEAVRLAAAAVDFGRSGVHDLPGPVFQKLADGEIAYLKLSQVRIADSESYIRQAEGTKGLIIDIRNYPSEFVVFSLGGRLVPSPTDFVRFTEADLSNPGAFHFRAGAQLTPLAPRYEGKIVILVDEVTQSQAEYTTMAFRTAPGAVVIGSTTAGADGNVSTIPLPGGHSSLISGIGVYYPDKTPTQRIGIVPDMTVLPTVGGIRAGRDELIDEAIRLIRR